jgi:SSS family solute:Na+ symporter
VGGFAFSLFFKFLPNIMNLSSWSPMASRTRNADGVYEIPFLDRMGFVFLIAVIGMVIISLIDSRRKVQPRGLVIDRSLFRMAPAFAAGALLVCGILAALYSIYW